MGTGLAAGFLFAGRGRIRRKGLSLTERFFKRVVDLAGAFAGGFLSIPLVFLAGLAVRLESTGSAFFVQTRIGEGGRAIKIIKIRTMKNGAEQLIDEIIKDNPLQGPVFKIPNDSRVTRVGRFLRRWSIDELPQFWNVLKGEMSLVGPRPEEARIVALYNDNQRQRLSVKPGMTGPMQINGRGKLDMDARLCLELEYINNYSFWSDLKILFKTIQAVISGEGAY
jgi:lipopolysaccharide/colanic/teichoic acid biosynthesis glycosyltransferase